MRNVAQAAYVAYTYGVFALFGLVALAAVLVVPGLRRRRAIARTASRLFLRFAGMPLTVKGLERLPTGQCIVVANHASYLDGLVFTAALPPRFAFVIKREMAGVPLAASMLRRIGAEFVERFNRNRGAADARRLLRKAESGLSLVFFPEGTFSTQPGLLKFHAGAFLTAARAGCPVVPAVVRGTRQALPPSGLLPRAAPITVELLPPVASPSGESRAAAAELRERARSTAPFVLECKRVLGPEARPRSAAPQHGPWRGPWRGPRQAQLEPGPSPAGPGPGPIYPWRRPCPTASSLLPPSARRSARSRACWRPSPLPSSVLPRCVPLSRNAVSRGRKCRR